MATLDQFSVILYTLRDFVKTREDALATFDKIADIGYQSIQVSGMSRDIFCEEELRDVLGERSLSICATHEDSWAILNETDKIIESLTKLGVSYTAYPFPAGVDFSDDASIDALIKSLALAGRKMRDAGITLCYHNHHHEFQHSRGKTVLRRIYDEIDPELLEGELDTYWVQRGGGSNVSWIRSLKGRLPLLHIKDFKLKPDSLEAIYTEIGNGNIDFPEIIEAGDDAGCKYYIVEQDTCPGDPFESIAISFDYIAENLAKTPVS